MNNQMSANEKKLNDIFSKEYRKYNIPNYQRPYSWNNSQAEDLFEDLIEAFEGSNGENEYFLGSIIAIQHRKEDLYDIIDGQQRLITLSLFFLSMKKIFEKNSFNLEEVNKYKVIHEIEERLSNSELMVKSNDVKINVRTIDQNFYNDLILDNRNLNYENISDSKNKMLSNYELFFEKLSEKNFNADTIIRFYKFLIMKVSIVLISTTNIDSSFRIFDVLNSRGLPLTTIDLLKSKIFEKVYIKYPERCHELEQQWFLLEESVGIDNLNGFYITHCLSKLEKNDLLFSKAVDKYEDRLNNDPNIIENPMIIIEDLKSSANNYLKFFNEKFKIPELNQSFQILNLINKNSRSKNKSSTYSVWIPPILALKNRMDDYNDITMEEFKEIVKIYEIFFFQMMILRFNKSQIQSSYGNLISAINRLEPYSLIKSILLKMLKNKDVLESLHKEFKVKTSSVNQLVKGLLLRLNFEKSDEKYFSIDIHDITLEHILPQTISNNYWNERYNKDEHLQWVNRIGNFALLKKSKNSSAKNIDFKKKKDIYEKETNSIFPLTRDILNYSDWNVNDLNKRHLYITDIAKKFLIYN